MFDKHAEVVCAALVQAAAQTASVFPFLFKLWYSYSNPELNMLSKGITQGMAVALDMVGFITVYLWNRLDNWGTDHSWDRISLMDILQI